MRVFGLRGVCTRGRGCPLGEYPGNASLTALVLLAAVDLCWKDHVWLAPVGVRGVCANSPDGRVAAMLIHDEPGQSFLLTAQGGTFELRTRPLGGAGGYRSSAFPGRPCPGKVTLLMQWLSKHLPALSPGNDRFEKE